MRISRKQGTRSWRKVRNHQDRSQSIRDRGKGWSGKHIPEIPNFPGETKSVKMEFETEPTLVKNFSANWGYLFKKVLKTGSWPFLGDCEQRLPSSTFMWSDKNNIWSRCTQNYIKLAMDIVIYRDKTSLLREVFIFKMFTSVIQANISMVHRIHEHSRTIHENVYAYQ